MTYTRLAAVLVGLLYLFLWVLALNGVSSLTPLLVVPPVLALLVAFGVWLNRFMGITPRAQHFVDPAATSAPAPSPAASPRSSSTEEPAGASTTSPEAPARDVED